MQMVPLGLTEDMCCQQQFVQRKVSTILKDFFNLLKVVFFPER